MSSTSVRVPVQIPIYRVNYRQKCYHVVHYIYNENSVEICLFVTNTTEATKKVIHKIPHKITSNDASILANEGIYRNESRKPLKNNIINNVSDIL